MVYSAISTRPWQRNGINGGEKGYTWWRSPVGGVNRPRLCRQHKKPRVQDYTVLAGVAQCQRRHSCFRLDALVVVKVDVTVNHLIGF